jgi:LPS-assembly protein
VRRLRAGAAALAPAAALVVAAALLAVTASPASAQVVNEPDPFASRFDQRTNFQIKFKPPEKGGEVRLYTKNPVRFEKDQFWEGSEEVVIEYQDIKITADAARYDFPTKTAVLTGHVVIDQGPTRLSGTRGTFHLDTKTGVLEDATADLPPTFHIVGSTIEKIGPATYRIRDGVFTACEMPDPEWSFTLSEATVTLDDYARMKNVAFRAGPVPILYTPYLIWPTKEDRASGMLVPGIGYSNQRGAYLGLSYFWVTGRPTDQTFHLDAYTDGSIGGGWESRWRPTDESAGLFQGYVIRDQNATVCVPEGQVPPGEGNGLCFLPNGQPGVYTQQPETRWKLRLDHVSDDLPFGFRGVLNIRDYSDQQYLQDYERSFSLNSARQIVSRGFLTKNFGTDSLNVRFERSETFYSSTVIQERFPSLEFFHRTAQIGPSPFYLSLQSSLSALYLNRGRDFTRGTYGRFDAYPIVSFPFKEIPWLSLTARAGGRVTYYTDSVDAPGGPFNGQSFTRTYGEGGVSFVGPSFSRIYDTQIGPWDKFKHIIEPRVDYQYVSDVPDPQQIPAFDEIDTALGRNQIRYAIVNRLLARQEGMKGSAEEIASLEIAQTYAFDFPQTIVPIPPTIQQRKTGPYEGILRIARPGLFHIDGRVAVDPFENQLTSATVTAGANWGPNYANFSWFGSRPVVTTPGAQPFNSDQFRFNGGLDLGPYFRVDASVAYDASSNLVQEDRGLLTYKGSCYTVFLEVRQLRLPPNPRNDYRLVVNLKDIGTILDINGSIDALFGQ